MAKVKKTIIRNDNTINAVYILKIFKNNNYQFTTLQKRNGCYAVISRSSGVCNNSN